jgi:hypothetical protein
MDIGWLDILPRLGFATLAGMAIGLNRDLQNKPTGMRTLGLVSLGAALVTLATIDFGQLSENPDALSRVVQGVIQGVLTGVGFICAGVILRDRQGFTVHGLTTAATVWVTATRLRARRVAGGTDWIWADFIAADARRVCRALRGTGVALRAAGTQINPNGPLLSAAVRPSHRVRTR